MQDFEALAATRFFAAAQERGSIVRTSRASDVDVPADAVPAAGSAAVLEHDRLPFLSWPYEWPFTMLKDAALSQLELLREALAEGVILKDGTPYNTQWRGARPVFIDVGSFERAPEGEPWFGYRQFCMQFLFPLMLQSFRGVPYRPFLRGKLDGIEPAEMARLLSLRDRLRRGVLSHVVLHARLERRHSSRSVRKARDDVKRAGFKRELIDANARQLIRRIETLAWAPKGSEWSGYGEAHGYSESEVAAKTDFVAQAAESRCPRLVWDLGCNDGRFSRAVAPHADYVVAIDADELAVDRLYRELREEGSDRILPLAMNLVDSSPAEGWRGRERGRLETRGQPELVLALALAHHITIGANVPVNEFVAWLGELASALVIEFPDRDDPMVERLLARKRAGAHPDYQRELFEAALERHFVVRRTERIARRTLYDADPR